LFAVDGEYAYILDKYRRLFRVDLSDPFSSKSVESFSGSISRSYGFLSIIPKEYNQVLVELANYLYLTYHLGKSLVISLTRRIGNLFSKIFKIGV